MTKILNTGLISILFFISLKISFAVEHNGINCNDAHTFCAVSCALNDVQAAANNAMASELSDTTIYIPICESNPYVWGVGDKLVLNTNPSKVIRLLGSGQDSTRIVHFQIDVPSSTQLNLVEFGHIGCNGNQAVDAMLDYRLRPETLNTELYWHHFSVEGYTTGYTLTFEGWLGVVSHLDMTCRDNGTGQNAYGVTIHGDGVYSDHSVDFGSRNAFFIEDSTFDGCSHTVSSFCDGYVVFRNNTIRNADSHTDLHGPGYNYCFYNPDEKTAGGGMELYDNHFFQSQGNWVINARAGQGHIYTNNRFDDPNYKILLYWDSGSSINGHNCGTGDGQTCGRCDTIDCEGCCQAQEKTYIWDNDGTVSEYLGGGVDDCLIEDTTYYLREPSLALDGFEYTRFAYPHPLVTGTALPDPGTNPNPDSGSNDSGSTGDGVGSSGGGCFINAELRH